MKRYYEEESATKNKQVSVKVRFRHGRWEKSKSVAFADECTVCGSLIRNCHDGYAIAYEYRFCPYCGSKMDNGTKRKREWWV